MTYMRPAARAAAKAARGASIDGADVCRVVVSKPSARLAASTGHVLQF